jgi:hypothetical protein
MKTKTRNISLIALAAGIAVVPLIRFLMQQWRARQTEKIDYSPSPEVTKGLFSAYRGSHLPHRRKPGLQNGHPLH